MLCTSKAAGAQGRRRDCVGLARRRRTSGEISVVAMFSVKVHAMEGVQAADEPPVKAPPSKESTNSPRLGSSEITELTEEPESTHSEGDRSRDGDTGSLGDIIVVGQMKFPASAGSSSASGTQAACMSGGSGAGEITEEPEEGPAAAPSTSTSSSYDEGAGMANAQLQRVAFSSGNPRVECWKGAVHLFRNTSEPPGTMANLPAGRGVRLCVLAVPNYMTVADYCRFCWPLLEHIEAIRVVRNDEIKDRYMVLMTMDSQDSADRFVRHFNGKPFSSLEGELCRVLFVASVEFTESEKEAATPPAGQTELPSCPVCLERLDQHISGILTTVCNHSFHSSCISNWTDSSCPVCRYGQEPSDASQCAVCGTSEDLWICVICGVVNCGRYREGHAVRHFETSQHCYSLELETQRVWDYVGDNYVHRLIQSKTDGKLVELPAPSHEEEGDGSHGNASRGGGRGGDGGGGASAWGEANRGAAGPGGVRRGDKFGPRRDEDLDAVLVESKMESIAFEYNHLLTTQLESQRQYFEGILAAARLERDEARAAAEKGGPAAKVQKLESQLQALMQELEFLKSVNESLVQNQKELQQQVAAQREREKGALQQRDARIVDLEEQVRDLMVFIEAQKVIEGSSGSSGSDLRGGSVLSVPSPPAAQPSKTPRSRSKRK